MTAPRPPRLDERRAAQFAAELRERAAAWISSWGLADGERDFGRALLDVAARFNSEVAERLDVAGEKMRRGFLDWLGIRGKAARPARVPVVFKLADGAPQSITARCPVRLQADANGVPVIFETEGDVSIVPAMIDRVVGTDAEQDAIYLAPLALTDLAPLQMMPSQWRLKSFAAAGTDKIQLDPEVGLTVDMLVRAGEREYTVVNVDKDLVTITPRLANDLAESSTFIKVSSFAVFDGAAHNWQEHALYLGDPELLNMDASGLLEVIGATGLRDSVDWQYWGTTEPDDTVEWRPLTVVSIDDIEDEQPATPCPSDCQEPAPGALLLRKPRGSIQEREINGRKARWIRAFIRTIPADETPFTTDELRLRIKPYVNVDPREEPPTVEGMTNTTPLVLDNVFFPLGKEPRQFDAFYLGSQEVFSKKQACVRLHFEVADRTFASLSAVRAGMFGNQVVAGVARDRSLHLLALSANTVRTFRQRNPLQPPYPRYQDSAQAGLSTAQLDPQPRWRLPVWADEDSGFSVAVPAANAVWTWREAPSSVQSGWVNFGVIRPVAPGDHTGITAIAHLAGVAGGAGPKLAALYNEELFVRDLGVEAPWDHVSTTIPGGVPVSVALKSIVPVLVDNGAGMLVSSVAEGMVGLSAEAILAVTLDGRCTIKHAGAFDAAIPPVAIKDASGLLIATVTATAPHTIRVYRGGAAPRDIALAIGEEVAGFDAVIINAVVHVLAVVRGPSGGRLLTWAPFEPGPGCSPFFTSVGSSSLAGAPTVVGDSVVLPAARADVLAATFDLRRRFIGQVARSNIASGLVLPVPALSNDDVVTRSAAPRVNRVTTTGAVHNGKVLYEQDFGFATGEQEFLVYRRSATLTGSLLAPDQLKLAPGDTLTRIDAHLLIDADLFRVTALTNDNPPIATLDVSAALPTTDEYVRPEQVSGKVVRYVTFDPNGNGAWPASRLADVPLTFYLSGNNIQNQDGEAFRTQQGNAVVVVLAGDFNSPLPDPVSFVLNDSFGVWRLNAGNTATNPELSWEYWNGRGWWTLGPVRDETQHLKMTGDVTFSVPTDIASSEWAGNTNYWIRARLIGGDYGREKMTVTITPLASGSSEQTVTRSPEDIHAPSVLRLDVRYHVCTAVRPAFVQTQDSLSFRDQSDANRTPGAIVEAFVPLSVTLGRFLRQDSRALASQPNDRPGACDQQGHFTEALATPAIPNASADSASVRATGRSLFIGVAGPVSGAPVNLLALVHERPHAAFAPLSIDSLVADRFTPVVASDATRGLGESGLLSMAFDVPPTPGELFGKSLRWLRLAPRATAAPAGMNPGEWKPDIYGLYLNAAWAGATETLTRELLGSSNGGPHLALRLARPPLLHATLELRIKEPLGEEERKALCEEQNDRVLSSVDSLPGDWVLWKEVLDPLNASAGERVYSLDEETGEVRFGDGLHGMIPPIGRDSIMAFKYQRTEPPPSGTEAVPGNAVRARMPLALISPLESVETVVAADHAAGGAPPESDERVLQHGFARLRHRERGVTALDLEDLALQSSPDIVQARALPRHGYVQLVPVMRGPNPRPSAAQARELHRLLLASAPPAMGNAGALRITPPVVRRLRIGLALQVATLDRAGTLADRVKERLTNFFSTAAGGTDRAGWLLGASPTAEDVAFALVDLPSLESIIDVKLYEVQGNTVEQPWPTQLKMAEIAVLADDPIRIRFETAEVAP